MSDQERIQAQWELAKELREQGHGIGTRIAAAKMLDESIEIMRDMDAMQTLLNRHGGSKHD